MTDQRALFTLDDDQARAIVDVLRAASFDDEHIATTLRADAIRATGDRRSAIQRHRTSDGTPLHTLIRLLVLGLAVDADAAGEALAPLPIERLRASGLLVDEHNVMVRAAVQLRCFQDMVVAWDFPQRDGAGRLPADYVMGISPSSLGLAGFTRRQRVGSVLDLGTGCGIQALLASRHADEVIATDANQRAVAMARFNTALNNVGNVTCALGSMFEPVGDRRFDLIVSNPPFIVSPDSEHLFLSTERPLDDLCRQLASEAANHLNDGGWCQFLANWAVGPDEPWRDHVQAWTAGSGCDVFVLRRSSQSIDDYAAEWIEPTAEGLAFDDAFDRWIAYYERAGVATIDFGLVTMRRRVGGHSNDGGGSNWFVGENAPNEVTYPAGDAIVEAFARHDFLRAHASDDALLATRLRVADDATMTQRLRLRDEAWAPIDAVVRRDRGLRYGFDVDAAGVALLARADGSATLRDVLIAVAGEFSAPPEALLVDGPAIARSLVERGVLIPA